MKSFLQTRREFVGTLALGSAAAVGAPPRAVAAERPSPVTLDADFFVKPEELMLRFSHGKGERRLSFARFRGPVKEWREQCHAKLTEILRFIAPRPSEPKLLRSMKVGDVTIEAWVMPVDDRLAIPGYVLRPRSPVSRERAVMAIHGHGEAESAVGLRDDYHHAFALRAAEAGHLVLCPALRGFGALADLAAGDESRCLDYWKSRRGRQFTLVSEAVLFGRSLIGPTIEDLLRWENWLAASAGIKRFDVAGISYGGDVALTYPVFSQRVNRIYASGSLGSFSVVFSRCYNAPAHTIPGVLDWMDRSDIAGLNAPRPIRLHYGSLDVPADWNNSASFNETVADSLAELRNIYRAFDAAEQITQFVSPGRHHEMDLSDLLGFLK